jgi:hypothetical protein
LGWKSNIRESDVSSLAFSPGLSFGGYRVYRLPECSGGTTKSHTNRYSAADLDSLDWNYHRIARNMVLMFEGKETIESLSDCADFFGVIE